jgi:hypothetical protein
VAELAAGSPEVEPRPLGTPLCARANVPEKIRMVANATVASFMAAPFRNDHNNPAAEYRLLRFLGEGGLKPDDYGFSASQRRARACGNTLGFRAKKSAGRQHGITRHRTGGDFVFSLVMPHLGFGKQPPALVRVKYRALAA